MNDRRRGRAVGRRGRVLLRLARDVRSAAPHAAAGAKHGRPHPAVRRRGARGRPARSAAGFRKRMEWFLNSRKDLSIWCRTGKCPASATPAAVAAARPADEGAAPAHARRGRVPLAVRRSRAVALHLDHPLRLEQDGQQFTFDTRRASPTPACSAATPTGAARSGCR